MKGDNIMSEVLTSLSDAMAAAVEAAGASVVRVEGRRRLPASGIAWSADGVIVTAHHVVEQDDNIGIGLPDGRTATAKLVGRDPGTDVAVLRLEAKNLKPPAWVEAATLRVGHLVLALGRPGQGVMATLGIVSALRKDWRTPAGAALDHYLQTDVVMYPGFSGGPLIDVRGQALGLNSSALVRGISVAVPSASLRTIVETLLTHGHVRRGYLGVGAQVARLPGNLAAGLGQETGLLLGSVETGSPAERGGLFMGDTIVALDGQPVRDLDDLLALLAGDHIGQAVAVRIVRGGQVQEVRVVIGEQA
jgi:S1-C subfamily serine protease